MKLKSCTHGTTSAFRPRSANSKRRSARETVAPGAVLGSCEPELARAEQRRIGHRVHRVEIRRHPPGDLADAEVTRRRQPEDSGGDTNAVRVEPAIRIAQEGRDRLALAERAAVPVGRSIDIPVGREANVVEHDLVESRPGRRSGDVDVVLPDAPVVRVRPPEAGRVPPDRAVGPLDREIRPRT